MEDYSRIEAYLNNELSASEREAFQTELQSDEALRTELAMYKDLVGGIRTAGLKADLKSLRAKQENSTVETGAKIFSLINMRTIAIAASVAVLVGFFFLNIGGDSDPFSSVYYKDAGLPTAMGEGNTEFLTAMVDYKNESYDEAIPVLKNVCETNQDDRACYYLAQSYLNSNDLEMARSQFLDVLKKDLDDKYLESTQWYLTYTLYLLEDDTYKEYLDDIKAKPAHRFYKDALQVHAK